MNSLALSISTIRRFVAIAAAATLLLGVSTAFHPASAAAGPFTSYRGTWSGAGKLRTNEKTERVRCTAAYDVRDSTGHAVALELTCRSDDYNFDLVADVQADASNHVSGRWTERSRNIGGTLIGIARGDQLRLHVESAAFVADVGMVTRGRHQSVRIDSHGAGQQVQAAITLRRQSR